SFRFERLELFDFCSVLAYMSNDLVRSFRYELNSLVHGCSSGELKLGQIGRLIGFFVTTIGAQTDRVYDLLVELFDFFDMVTPQADVDFSQLYEQIYLGDQSSIPPIESPYFGL